MAANAAGVWLALAAMAAAPALAATVESLVALVRASVSQGEPDKALAKSLRKVALGERLDRRTVEELESAGAGPASVGELEKLLEATARRPAPAHPPRWESPPRPTAEEQRAAFHQTARVALNYAAGLPDFICTQTVRRYADARRQGTWQARDVLTVRLTYFDRKERYELTAVNGRKTAATYKSVGGAVAEGDFGTTLVELFAPDTETRFEWTGWTHLRRRLANVYSFRTRAEKSHYRLTTGIERAGQDAVTVGRRGWVYADAESGAVLRIVGDAAEIPPEYTVIGASTVLDFGPSEVGGRAYLVPVRADSQVRTHRTAYRNVVEFRDYRKFSGESSISFETPEAAPPQ